MPSRWRRSSLKLLTLPPRLWMELLPVVQAVRCSRAPAASRGSRKSCSLFLSATREFQKARVLKLLCRGVSPAFCLLRCPVCLLAKACLLRRCSASWIREVFVLLATSVRCGARSGVDLRTRFSREGSSPGLCLLAPSSGCTRGSPTAEPPDITPLLFSLSRVIFVFFTGTPPIPSVRTAPVWSM